VQAGSIFPTFSLDRAVVNWETYLNDLTPVEKRGGIYYKREDYFAPLGYGGINGAKLRQCIWLIGRARARGAKILISGASVKSPQLPMGTAVALHYGMSARLVIGSPRMETALRHDNVAIAARLGAQFELAKIAYNPALQRMVNDIAARTPDSFVLEYGITVTRPDAAVEEFHRLGAEQARNIPDEVETLVIPAGSCNSCVSVLYGIVKYPPKNLKRIILIGIGPTRLDFIDQRLRRIETFSGLPIRSQFRRWYHDGPRELEVGHNATAGPRDARWELHHWDLHATGYATYQDEMPYSANGIDFHPTYEGKVMTYLRERAKEFDAFWSGRSMMWIIGSAPNSGVMAAAIAARRRTA
jgi:1-aminocyclopropane-1-carboxylate deaminase/D-cysteine desulfhydrase-like pyridoxal-dependent ACC family enzyme